MVCPVSFVSNNKNNNSKNNNKNIITIIITLNNAIDLENSFLFGFFFNQSGLF